MKNNKLNVESIVKAYHNMERRVMIDNFSIELSESFSNLSEADLQKLTRNSIDLLCRDKGDPIMRSIYNIPIIISAQHIQKKRKSRFIQHSEARHLITDAIDYLEHIAKIIKLVFDTYGGQAFSNKLNNIMNSEIPDIDKIEDWDDEIDDIPMKFSTYRIFKYDNRFFMIEGAIAIGLSAFSLNGMTLDFIKKSKPYLWDEIVEIDKLYPGGFIDLNAFQYHPVLTVTSYATWVKRIKSLTDFSIVPCDELGHNDSLTELFETELNEDNLVYRVQYDTPLLNGEIDSKIFKVLCDFEINRIKGEYDDKK